MRERKTKGWWRQGLTEETWKKTTDEGISKDKKRNKFHGEQKTSTRLTEEKGIKNK
jgi:hypothetical protein